ncbi:MAG: hypothetical protein IJT18_05680 [Oscillospiraceae bacterium]|nr:hypothetical protein [Oscillospiraceae bacterium]
MTREVSYALMDPDGNRTVLVTTPVSVAEQPAVAAALMAQEPTAEQTGFFSREGDKLTLRMAGGEFCGNATMSAAAYHAVKAGISGGVFAVTVSGADAPVRVELEPLSGGAWQGTVAMPTPVSARQVRFPDGQTLPVVAFKGISHVIAEQPISREDAERLVKSRCAYLGADALGLLFLDRRANTLTPLVYVPAADTLFWESACGSGASAVGWWLACEVDKRVTSAFRQPGGTLTVTASPDGEITLRGTVRCVYEKTVSIDL